MHIADGVLSAPILLTGSLIGAAGVIKGLHHLDYEQMPQVAVLCCAFFLASLIQIPLGVSSVHLVLNGLMGVILGWATFPVILIALLLQAILFGFGGLTVLGVNVLNMSLPALLCFYLFNRAIRIETRKDYIFYYGYLAGALAIIFSTLMIAGCLWLMGEIFLRVIQLMIIAHLPVMLIEGFITGTIMVFLHQVRPQLLSISFN
jgi:cobalt/nickel transport system permease protein